MAISVILSRLAIPPVVSISIMQKRSVLKFITLYWIINLICGSNVSSFNDFYASHEPKIYPGAASIPDYLPLLRNKKVALVVNHSSLINGTHLSDTLIKLGVNVTVLFAPEHGFRGDIQAGDKVLNSEDEKSGLQIISLYGKNFKPEPKDLREIDIMVFDIQDVGVRFFTYISTLHYIMESCAENKIPLLLLDRPNPNGHYIDGPVLDTTFRSFIGMHPIPIVYGLTIGELALMIKGECWINKCKELDIKIIKCKNYTHSSRVRLDIRPSPNLPNERAILLYPSLCLFEGTSVSLGRGTDFPFQIFGHPNMKQSGSFEFIPRSKPESINPPWKDSLCFGIDLRTISVDTLLNQRFINLSYLLNSYHFLNFQSDFFLSNNFFDKLAGTNKLRLQMQSRLPELEIRKSWKKELSLYKSKCRKYLLYE